MSKVNISPEVVERYAKLLDTGELQVAQPFCAEILRAQAERIKELEAERDAFRAVLEGAEYREIDEIAKQDPDMCRMLGAAVASLTKREIDNARKDAAMDRLVAEGQRCDAMTPQEAAKDLIGIVEGINNLSHGTWRDEKGQRLKDTPEWVKFYNAISEDSHE